MLEGGFTCLFPLVLVDGNRWNPKTIAFSSDTQSDPVEEFTSKEKTVDWAGPARQRLVNMGRGGREQRGRKKRRGQSCKERKSVEHAEMRAESGEATFTLGAKIEEGRAVFRVRLGEKDKQRPTSDRLKGHGWANRATEA